MKLSPYSVHDIRFGAPLADTQYALEPSAPPITGCQNISHTRPRGRTHQVDGKRVPGTTHTFRACLRHLPAAEFYRRSGLSVHINSRKSGKTRFAMLASERTHTRARQEPHICHPKCWARALCRSLARSLSVAKPPNLLHFWLVCSTPRAIKMCQRQNIYARVGQSTVVAV